MKSTQIQQLKRSLEGQREEALGLLHRMGDESRALDTNTPQDTGDQSMTTVSKEFLFQQGSRCRGVVRRIEAALTRMDQGTFGICSECGNEIPIRRLEALPWTDLCLHCQESREREQASGSRFGSRAADELLESA